MRRLLPLGLAGFLLACGGTSTPDAAPATDTPTSTAPAAAVAEPPAATTEQVPATGGVVADVPEALQFSAPLVGGGDIELTTLAGRPVLLWFWAPW